MFCLVLMRAFWSYKSKKSGVGGMLGPALFGAYILPQDTLFRASHSSSSSSSRGLLGPLATGPALLTGVTLAWPGPQLWAPPHVGCLLVWALAAWWVDCRAVLSPRSSGCWPLSFPSCHLSQFLAHSRSAQQELRAPSFGLASFLSCLFRRFLPENPCLWLDVSLAALWDCVKGISCQGTWHFKPSSETHLPYCVPVISKNWKNRSVMLCLNTKPAAATNSEPCGYRKSSSHLVGWPKGQLMWQQ